VTTEPVVNWGNTQLLSTMLLCQPVSRGIQVSQGWLWQQVCAVHILQLCGCLMTV